MTRCDSGTDSKVWMEEDTGMLPFLYFVRLCPKIDVFGHYLFGGNKNGKAEKSTRYMAVVAMFSAVAFVAVVLSKVIPDVAGFLSYEPKDVGDRYCGLYLRAPDKRAYLGDCLLCRDDNDQRHRPLRHDYEYRFHLCFRRPCRLVL